MSHRRLLSAAVIVVLAAMTPAAAVAQFNERRIVAEAGVVLQEIMAIPAKGIPRALLADAQGLVIVPGMIRGGFVIGVKHGRGIAVVRDANGAWTNPVFVRITGGNIGFQAGLQATDLILVFRNRTRIEEMMRGRFTIGANAGVAAGPIGRATSAATDAQMRAEILSYSRSRGLFAGVSIDGAVIQPEPHSTAIFYGQSTSSPQGRTPAAAVRFLEILNALSGAAPDTVVAVPHEAREELCEQLLAAHERLLAVLDPAWQEHLAFPDDLTEPTPAGQEHLREVQARFNRLVDDPAFKALTDRQEFQETLTLLNRHAWLQEAAAANVLKLPPPPR
jgi:lipid-binding SYLF domain-containing protein